MGGTTSGSWQLLRLSSHRHSPSHSFTLALPAKATVATALPWQSAHRDDVTSHSFHSSYQGLLQFWMMRWHCTFKSWWTHPPLQGEKKKKKKFPCTSAYWIWSVVQTRWFFIKFILVVKVSRPGILVSHRERERERENSNLTILFYKDKFRFSQKPV